MVTDRPRWVTLRRAPQVCARCGRVIYVRKPAFMLPSHLTFFCGARECGCRMAAQLMGNRS